MRLIIHGGIHRTGTTTLQRFLSDNRRQLLDQGILYPFDTVNHQRLAWGIFAGRLSGREFSARLQSAAAEANVETVLVSGEDFCIHKDLGWLQTVRRDFDVEAVFYLRRQDVWLMSWYNQHIKWPFDKKKSKMSSEEFLQTLDDYYWIDFHWLAGQWSAALGKEKVRLRVFESGIDIVVDFCRELGIETSGTVAAEKAENASLPPQLLEFVRQFDIQSFLPGERGRFLNAVRKIAEDQKFTGNNVYSPTVRNLILQRFAESNRRTAVDYFAAPEGRLFAEEHVAESEPYATARLPDGAELMRAFVVPLVRHIVTAHRKK